MTDPIKAEPVAWMYEGPHGADLCLAQWADGKWYAPRNWRDWTETPLYTHAQLVEERRLAWNEAIDLLRRADDQLTQLHGYCYLSSRSWPCVPADEIRATINAIRALTKDSTHD